MSIWDDVGDAWDDTVEWAEDTAEDVGEFIEDTAEDIGDFIEETADDIGGYASDFFEGAGDVVDATWTAAEDTYEAAGDAASAVVDPVLEEIVSPVGDALLSGLENSGFFDVVDYATLGFIDMEYGDNGFNASFGIDDLFETSFNVGNGGFAVDTSYAGQHLGLSLNDDGFAGSAAVGIDWGPLPYAEGHASVEADGDIGAGGEWQGYFPLPGGMVGGHVAGDYQETDDGFGTSWDVTPGVYEPTGEYVGVGTHGSYSEDKDGYDFNVGVHAEAGQAGVGKVRGSLDYNESREGDIRTQGVSASVSAEDEITHTKVEGTIGYQHTETPDGDYDSVYVAGEVDADGVKIGGQASGTVGPDGSVTVAGEIHGSAEGYEIGAHGSTTVGPDGVTVDGGIDDFETPYEIPDLPDDVPGLPDPGSVVNDLANRAVDQGRAAVDEALANVPTVPDVPSVPDMPSVPDVPDVPAAPDLPTMPDAPDDDSLPF